MTVSDRITQLRSQDGFTLVELLVATSAMLIVFFAAVSYLAIASRAEATNYNRANKLDEMSVALERFTREARDAKSIGYVSGGQGRKVRLTLRSGTTVDYECVEDGKTTCVRIEGARRTVLAKGVQQTNNTFNLSCRFKDPSGTDPGKLMNIPTSGTIPSDCGTNPPSYVELKLLGTVDCEGEGRTDACPTRSITLWGGVALRNAQ